MTKYRAFVKKLNFGNQNFVQWSTHATLIHEEVLLSSMCMCMVYVYVHVRVCVCVCVCDECDSQRSMLGVCFNHSLPYFLRQEISLNLHFTNLARLAGPGFFFFFV
jgi:hypothetical protein